MLAADDTSGFKDGGTWQSNLCAGLVGRTLNLECTVEYGPFVSQ